MENLIAIGDVLLVKYAKKKEELDSKFIVVNTYMDNFLKADVLSIGGKVKKASKGDTVLAHKYSGKRIGSIEKESYDIIALREKELIAKIKEE